MQYGGKITDSLDVRLFRTYTKEWLTERTCEDGYAYNPIAPVLKLPNDFQYIVPSFPEHSDCRRYIEQLPENDSPEIFGLHPNADLAYCVKEATSLFERLGETQPKGGGGDGGISREDVAYEKASELLKRLPEDYDEDDYKAKIKTSDWKAALKPALDGLAADLIIDCRSSTYAGVWQSPPANTVAVRVFKKEKGKISVITHLSKKYRGELTRVLLKSGKPPKTPSELLAIAEKRFDCKLQKPKGNLPWYLDLIIS